MTGYGVFVHNGQTAVGYRAGDGVVDLTRAERDGRVDAKGTFETGSLDAFLGLGRAPWSTVQDVVAGLEPDLALADVEARMPFRVGDYVDFYSSEHHALNVSRILRPERASLQPNWKRLPVGYHGRSGTVVASGTPIRRPNGQRGIGDFGPSERLDVEAEIGFVVGVPSKLGEPVSTVDFAEHVFGMVLVNDWSARDIQAWEYQPLGPFLGKSFATSMATWITPLCALSTVDAPEQDPPVLDYLREEERHTFDIDLAVRWNGTVVSRPPYRQMYWTPAQQLAHLTSGGASVRTGDLYASGTVSGPGALQVGSFLELSQGGARPVPLGDGSTRTFLRDGDEVTIEATATAADGGRIRLAEVTGKVRGDE